MRGTTILDLTSFFDAHPAWLTAILAVVTNCLGYAAGVWKAGRRVRQLSTSKEFDAVLSGREALEHNQLKMIETLQGELERARATIGTAYDRIKVLDDQVRELDRRLSLCEESRKKFDELQKQQELAARLSREASGEHRR